MERLALLELRAARGWSWLHVAVRFHGTTATVASRMARLDEEGPSALVQTPEPVNEIPAFAGFLVQRLGVLRPAKGSARIAAVLSRAGLHFGMTRSARC